MRVIVGGGREFQAAIWLYSVLDEIHAKTPISLIIEGGQRTYETNPRTRRKEAVGGADYWASVWAMGRRVETVRVEAKWSELGDRAGPIRNAEMLSTYKPDLVVAAPGGTGTADMVRKAKAAGVRVVDMKP